MTDNTHNKALSVGSKFKFSIIFTAFILAVELVGGFISNSLALLSDAGHVFTDIVALSLSWYALRQAERPPSSRMTFGYHRIGVIVAVANAISILAIAEAGSWS
jgi:cobalt-zinc-cadmium efflux system protein